MRTGVGVMNINHVYFFLDIAQTGSISKSAKKFYLTQQGMSRAIASLEKDCGHPLLNRANNRIELTPYGRYFAQCATEFIKQYEAFLSKVSKPGEVVQAKETVRIYTTPYLSQSLFRVMYAELVQAFPHLSIVINEAPFDAIMDLAPTRTGSDVFFVDAPDFLADKVLANRGLVFSALFSSELMVAVGPQTSLAAKRMVHLDDLKSLPFAYYRDATLEKIIEYELPDLSEDDVMLAATSFDLINQMVAAGKAFTFTDSFAAESYSEGHSWVSVPIADGVTMYYGLLDSIDCPCSGEALKVASHIRRFCKNRFSQ